MADQPTGRRFSQLYIERSATPLRDSVRLRTRLHGQFSSIEPFDRARLASTVKQELGIDAGPGHLVKYTHGWNDFFAKAAMRDVLDAITLIGDQLTKSRMAKGAADWLSFVRRAMHEENVGYRVDDKCVVHLLVDTEFESNAAATIEALASPRYRAALEQFEKAHSCLDEDPPNGKGAVRDTFEAAETLFRLICGADKVQRIETAAIEKFLKPIVRAIYAANPPALNAANSMLNAFGDWAVSCHHYRPGQGTEEPMPPPLDLAVAMMSAGASFIRWLAEIDQQSSGKA